MEINHPCPVCNQRKIKVIESVEFQITNTEAFKQQGIPLDLRGYSSIIKDLYYCPQCHYIWQHDKEEHDISKFLETADSEKFLYWINHHELPETVRIFMGYYVTAFEENKYQCAGIASLHAAWACDDLELTGYSRSCRKSAAKTLCMHLEQGTSEYLTVYALQAIDSYRRLGEYGSALNTIARLINEELIDFNIERRVASRLSSKKEEEINHYGLLDKWLMYQYSLCISGDKKIHYSDEIPEDISDDLLKSFFEQITQMPYL